MTYKYRRIDEDAQSAAHVKSLAMQEEERALRLELSVEMQEDPNDELVTQAKAARKKANAWKTLAEVKSAEVRDQVHRPVLEDLLSQFETQRASCIAEQDFMAEAGEDEAKWRVLDGRGQVIGLAEYETAIADFDRALDAVTLRLDKLPVSKEPAPTASRGTRRAAKKTTARRRPARKR